MLAVLLLAGMAACGGRAAPDDLPADPDVLVLQVAEQRSIPHPWDLGPLPEFSLYGSGRVIVPAGGSAALRSAREFQLSPDAFRDVVDRAYEARLDRGEEIADEPHTDASLLVITLATADGVRTTRVVAPDAGGGDRSRIESFVRALPAAPADAAAYRPPAVALLAVAGAGSEPPVRPWPGTPLDQGVRTQQGRCTVAGDAAPLAGLPQDASRWSSGGKIYTVLARPLLPGEHGCPDLDR
ncbi:hypothetical protein GCM10023107_65450 [Actinoplanes octamycinicus]